MDDQEQIQLIDIRESNEKRNGDLGGNPDILQALLLRIKESVVYCQSGRRSFILMRQLKKRRI